MTKLTAFSGIQPSGDLTLGNYIGAIRQWVKIQYDYRCIYCIVDLHAITMCQNATQLGKRSLDVLALLLSCGLDPDNVIIFIQSHVPQHVQLSWLLSCYSYFGELRRMTQFKDKSTNFLNNSNNINVGLFNYPILMASDILLYQTSLVPIGDDQKQHLELSRRIADRFNSLYGRIFTVPDFYVPKFGSRIMSLLEPCKKMSKSDFNQKNVIFLLEDIDSVVNKLNCSITDSDDPPVISYDKINKPGISNLLSILSGLSEVGIYDLELSFKGKKYIQLKNKIIELVTYKLKKLQKRYFLLRREEDYLYEILSRGAEKARSEADVTLSKVYDVIGLLKSNTGFKY
ncbi:tryptophan--tRNA ligase [Blochmannia endosymbiont of Colobopsis nipponica]|uniref:tryptophan--tRNA ligase n=1 Tax=Blochmannia endosymbiont of Colobopsis nipponica TaxID=2681987 RepID=UPI0017825BCE|nr:tryptophan--tRNA ligase [Blochmannia endosymbiont of Colobopsis nipponica]QOI10905.1 tryptophan--tRNA ligase [Blochmannia endosymbiont of Colobopsis nipponica]